MRNRYLLLLLAMLAAALLSWWLFSQSRDDAPARAGGQDHRPDFFLDDFVLTVMDEQGQPRRRVVAPHMVHYRDDDSAEVTQPDADIYRQTGPDWRIRAQHAWIGPGGDEVILRRDVKVERIATPRYAPLTMLTEELLARPDQDYMETDRAVVFLSPGTRVDAVGMRGWLEQGRMLLLSEVRGVHEPATP